MTRVLIVDDNPMDQRIAAGCLKDDGIECVFANDGREALNMLKANSVVDLVLTDLNMPELDGLELVQEIKLGAWNLPVILMTAEGSEEIAVTALKTGAASYVPKRNLKTDLAQAVRIVLDVSRARKQRQQVYQYMQATESHFEIGYEPSAPQALISYLQDGLRVMDLCGEGELLRVGTALTEAILNAIEHGNLELDSRLKERPNRAWETTARERMTQQPFASRRVKVSVRMTSEEAVYTITDQGPGFDLSKVPDPTDPENLMKPHGRGLMLIRTFMDDVLFNETGNQVTLVKTRKRTD